ncbi:hypothetical protein BDP55DRAFT_568276, partial [Colletotrichum godetiae]
NLNIRAAVKIYNISYVTLSRRLEGTIFNLRNLMLLKKKKLIKYILDLNARSFFPHLYSIKEIAN